MKIVKKAKSKKYKPTHDSRCRMGARCKNCREIIEQRFRFFDWLGRPRPRTFGGRGLPSSEFGGLQ